VTIQRKFGEFEALFEKLRPQLTENYEKPPKKKILGTEAKLAEKRRLWLEYFVNDMILNHYEK
jgi:hypothetical protein